MWIGRAMEASLEMSMGSGSRDSLGGLVQRIASLLSCGGCGMVYIYAAVEIWIL